MKKHFSPTLTQKTFNGLAISVNMAFERLSMYDLDQTISCSILRQKEIFDQLASFGNKVSSKRKKISDHKKST